MTSPTWQIKSTYTRVMLRRADGKRTSAGTRLLRWIGECIKQGGSVQMQTYYIGTQEYADAVLIWESGNC